MLSAWLLAIGAILQVVTADTIIIPPIYDYDNLTQCRLDYPSAAVFCYVKVVTKGRDPFHSSHDADSIRVVIQFRRNLLDHGICVQDCEREVAALSQADRERLYCEEFPVGFRHIYNTWHWKDQLEPYRERYSRLINICVNNRLERRYNLTYHGHSKIEYCVSSEPEEKPCDLLKSAFLSIASALLAIFLFANVWDLFGKSRDCLLVSAFSLRATWASFIEESKSALYQDFAYLDGLRVVINLIVLYCHSTLMVSSLPIDNVEYLEEQNSDITIRYVCGLFMFLVKVFLAIAGMLLTVNFMRDIQRKPNLEPGYFRSKIINRLIRLLPVYYFFLLATTVQAILPGVELGLHGYMTLVRDQQICRSNGWTNVLMINNLPFFEEQCFAHGWYLGADFQLFLLGLLILWVIWKFPRAAKKLFWAMSVVSVAIPSIVFYRNRMETIPPVRLSAMPFVFMFEKYTGLMYAPGYTNINSFLGGMISGYLYHKIKHDKLNPSDYWLYNLLHKISVPLFVVSFLPINLFYTHDVPQWGVQLHSLIYRNIVMIMVCLGFIRCFQSPKGWFRRILSSRIMTTLGKLSYGSYLVHVLLLRYHVNGSSELMHYSVSTVASLTLTNIALSYLASLLVYLVIEQPLATVLKRMCLENKKTKKD